MKKAAKVLIIITMCASFCAMIVSLIVTVWTLSESVVLGGIAGVGTLILFFYLIIPLLVGAFALRKLIDAQSKSELTSMAILTLIFCNLIAGILMLCVDEREFASAKPQK